MVGLWAGAGVGVGAGAVALVGAGAGPGLESNILIGMLDEVATKVEALVRPATDDDLDSGPWSSNRGK